MARRAARPIKLNGRTTSAAMAGATTSLRPTAAARRTLSSMATGIYTLPGGQKFTDDFHTFAIEWEPAAIRFYVDDNLYQTKTPTDAAGKPWVFDHPFFIILNVAIGGSFPGSPDATTTFPQTMT